MDNIENKICCSFCRKSADEVRQLVAGDGIYICDECIETCYEIVNGVEPKKAKKGKKSAEFVLPTPKEIKVELPDEEEKPAPKKKVIFSRKKQQMQVYFQATRKQREMLGYWHDNTTTEI